MSELDVCALIRKLIMRNEYNNKQNHLDRHTVYMFLLHGLSCACIHVMQLQETTKTLVMLTWLWLLSCRC